MTLTDDYLAAVAAAGQQPGDLMQTLLPAVQDTMYYGRCLTRPVFLDAPAFRQLHHDLENLHAALTTLPQRLFGGDLRAFGLAVGLTEQQVDAVVRGSSTPTRICRADLYRDATGFRLLEVNMGANVGGLDNTVLNEAMLADPVIKQFVTDRGLVFENTMAELAHTLRVEAGVPDGVRPFVAVADWPDSYPTLKDILAKSAVMLAEYGIDALACPVDALEYHDGRVWLGERAVDVVYRLFLVENLREPEAPGYLEPLLAGAERGEVAIFAPLDAELYGTKGSLALLSDEANRDRFSAAELESLDRLLPWTRIVRRGPVTVGERTVDLVEHAVAAREDLVLKPVADFGGAGVVLGWQVDDATWREHLNASMDGRFVLQERVRPEPEYFPSDDGLEPWTLTWGSFLGARGYAGTWVRGSKDPDGGVVNMATGATATCAFHAP